MGDIYTPQILTATVNSLQVPPQFLVGTFFPNTQNETSEEIHFDVENDVLGLAPFVSPLVEGEIITEKGYSTKTFKPAYVKPKSPIDPNRPFRRYPGEPIGGNLDPMQRLERITTDVLMDHRKLIDRRKEWMAAQVLRLGTVTISGEKYTTVVVDFGRDAALIVVKGGGTKWGDAGIKPLDDLQTWGEVVFEKSGSTAFNVVMDLDAWKVFRADTQVQARLDLLRAAQSPFKLDAKIDSGGTFMGNIDGFNIYVYNGFYKDSAGALQKMLPSGTVLMVGDIQGVNAYGAIRDEEAGMQAIPIFSKSWVEKDPSQRVVLSQSAPLLVPYRVNASFRATVL